MSDFLTSLAARTLGVSPPVRPQVPSLFEGRPASRAVTSTPDVAVTSRAAAVASRTDVPNSPLPKTPLEREKERALPRVQGASTRVGIDPLQSISAEPKSIAAAAEKPAAQTVAQALPWLSVPKPKPFGVRAASLRAEKRPVPNAAPLKSEPAIKIHIGRVDVRAVFPTAPAAAPRPKVRAAALSLDDYLAQQNGRAS